MIVLDTHALIWWFEGDPRLSAAAREAISGAGVRIIPAIVFWEIALLVAKGRLTLSADVRNFFSIALQLPRVEVAPLTPEVAVRASLLGPEFHADPADRLIAATAIELDAPLLTRDRPMHAFPALRTIW